MVSTSSKLSFGTVTVGSMIADVLGEQDLKTGLRQEAAADVAPEIITRLGLLYGPLVALFGVFAIWLYTRYSLDRHKHAAILAELRTRRATIVPQSLATGAL